MFVVVDPKNNRVYGSFATFEEANIWGEVNMYKGVRLSYSWYVNAVTQVASDCPIPSAPQSSGDGDCC